MARAVAVLALLAGCSHSDDGTDGSTTPTDSSPDATGDTGTTPSTDAHSTTTDETGGSTSDHTGTTSADAVGLTCTATDNALRFTCQVTTDPPAGVELRFEKADGSGITRTVSDPDALGVH